MTPFKGLLIDGTSGVGKSSLIDALIRHHVATSKPRKIRSLVHLAQSHTYGPLASLEDGDNLTVAENLLHLDRIVSHLEWLHRSVQEHSKPWCFVILDTLHLTHCVRPGIVRWADVEPIDRRLAALGCKLVSLSVSSSNLWQRGIEPRKDEQFLLEYAKKFGRTNEEIHAYFVREQEVLSDLYSRSIMPKLTLHNDGPIERILGEVYRFWMEDPMHHPLTDASSADTFRSPQP
jgi:hypothetical protein